MARLPLDQSIPRLKGNEERVDLFVNGDENTDWRSDDGSANPSIRKLVKIINTEGEGWLADAEAAANSSAASAGAAAGSESAASSSAQDAANSASAASTSADQASTSAGAAQGSAQGAATSATAASASAGEAAGSAGAAQGSAQNASNSAAAAATSVGDAAGSAVAAQGSAQDAASSAGAASTSAGQAAASASAAEGFAEDARDVVLAIGSPVAYTNQSPSEAERSQARGNLGLGDLATKGKAAIVDDTEGTLTVARGGTGATTQAVARGNLGLQYASEAEAKEGTAQDRAMTPLRVAQAIEELAGDGTPIGTIVWFAAPTPPEGWLVCEGQQVTPLYPELRAFMFGAGSPFGTSNENPLLPDLRGEFVRGWDGGRGVDAGRVFGSAQEEELKLHGHPTNWNTVNGQTGGVSGGIMTRGDNEFHPPHTGPAGSARGTAIGGFGGDETRPRNVALLPMIKAFGAVTNIPGQADLEAVLSSIGTMAARDFTYGTDDPTGGVDGDIYFKLV